MSYIAYKFFHVAAVMVFLGNIITGLSWKAHAAVVLIVFKPLLRGLQHIRYMRKYRCVRNVMQ
jgi:hypothetical protein